jgi:CRISPR-associated protein Csm5
VLSPVHIGTREGRLLPIEYLVEGGRVHVIDDEKFGRFLLESGSGGQQLIDQFVQAARNGDLGKGLTRFLKEKARIAPAAMRGVAERVSSYQVDGAHRDMTDFRPLTRDGFGRVYIPGTALKGAFRTAILYRTLRDDPVRKASIETKVQHKIHELDKGGKRKEPMKRFLSQELIQGDILQAYDLKTARQPQNRDLLRCLRVRDAYALKGTLQTKVIKIEFLSKAKGGSFYWSQQKKWDHRQGGRVDTGTPLSIFVEGITEGVFETELTWDEGLFEVFRRENGSVSTWPVNGLDDLIQAISITSGDVTRHETEFFKGSGEHARSSLQSWYGGLKGDLLRIGFGSGMLGTTVNLLWSDPLRQIIRNTCGDPRGDDPAPKSRRVWQNGQSDWRPMGWVRLVGEGECLDKLVARAAAAAEHTSSTAPPQSQPQIQTNAPRVRVQPLETLKPSAKDILAQVRTVPLEKSFNLERLVESLDSLAPEDAHAAATILKERLMKSGQWKKHPLKGEIEVFIET